MSDPRWTTVDGLFEAALELDPQERASFLRASCGSNETLRREVESLLAHGSGAGDFLAGPALELAGRLRLEERTESLVGRQLGTHRILGLLGRGGMGEVYRAHDTQLGRDVAIKILPRVFHTDPERRARFDREARMLAALNHPHIGGIHGLENLDGTPALILELVEGDTLAERVARGPIAINEALLMARQIAEALEAAHDKGIVHRDLKPANIKITPQGVVKVLDFGLAKAADPAEAGRYASDASASPTVTIGATREGVLLGTAAYMSPEQARGRAADKRTDIWAFGCVLYEMLAGRAPFARDTITDTLAALVERDPDWQALPAATPAKIRDLLRRCLQKDPQRRLRDIGDAYLDVDDAIAPAAMGNVAITVDRRPIAQSVVGAAILASAITASILLLVRRAPEVAPQDLVLTIAPPSSSGIQPVETGLASPEISPDGSYVAYHDRSGTLRLRRLNAISTEAFPATTGLAKVWSPDSASLLFADDTTLKRIRVPDGAPEIIGKVPAPFSNASLSESGVLLFVCCPTGGFRLFIVPGSGAEAREISVPGLKDGGYQHVSFLPGGEDVLVGFTPRGAEETDIYLATLRDQEIASPVLLMRTDTEPRYTPAGGGRLLFVRNDNLYAQTLNRSTRRLEGDAKLVQQGVASRRLGALFSVSRSGVVAWRPGRAALGRVTIFNRQGKPIGTAGSLTSDYGSLRLSPDEQRVLVTARDGRAWILQANQPGRFNVRQGDLSMLWSADGSNVLVPEASRIVERPLSGTSDGRERARVPGLARLEDVSADGKVVLFSTSMSTLYFIRLDETAEGRVATMVETGEPVGNARFSPDQRWIVYQGRQPQAGVYVQSFPGPALPKQVASTGESAVWRSDGKEILYLDRDSIWSVRVDTAGGEFRASPPELLFSVRSSEGGRRLNGIAQLAVSRDGTRIYYQQPVEQPDSDLIHIRMGWEDGAARRE